MSLYKYIRILSLDVVAGACISTLFIAKVLQVELSIPIVISLGLTVWIIYTIDHLLDGLKIPHKAHSIRHSFHQKYFKTISYCLIMALILAGSLLFLLPVETLRYGILLSTVVIIYFIVLQLLNRHNVYLKEISIGLIYSLGLFLGPLSLTENIAIWKVIPLFLQFYGLSTANLMIFSLFEKELDSEDGHSSIVQYYGENAVRSFSIYLLAITLTFTVILIPFRPQVFPQLVIFCMGIVLITLLLKPGLFKKYEIYRIMGDGVFLIPILIL